MKRHIVSLAALGSMLLLSGCAVAPPLENPPWAIVDIAPDVSLALPSPAAFVDPVDVAQQVIARYGDSTLVFETRLSVHDGTLRLTALDTLGRRALTLSWTDAHLEAETAPWLPEALRIHHLLGDLVLIYWPSAALRAGLTGARLALDTPERRVLFAGDQEIVSIAYAPARGWNSEAQLENRAWGYIITVRSKEIVR